MRIVGEASQTTRGQDNGGSSISGIIPNCRPQDLLRPSLCGGSLQAVITVPPQTTDWWQLYL